MKAPIFIALIAISLMIGCTQDLKQNEPLSEPQEVAAKELPSLIVEKIPMASTIDTLYISYVPKLVDTSNAQNPTVQKINAYLLERFMIDSFESGEGEEFRWYDLDFEHEIKEDILFISFAGEYYGAYLNQVEEELFFDLKTGESLSNRDLPFHALFTLDGYLEFMQTHWLPAAVPAFEEAIECAQSEPYCSYYDIDQYQVADDVVAVALAGDCYARVNLACSPEVRVLVPISEMKEYLSELGQQILFEDRYTGKQGVEKYVYNQQIQPQVPHHLFLFGKIDGKYPFSMALEMEELEISGYYFYDRKQEKLQIRGKSLGDYSMELEEYVNDQQTGSFYLESSSTYSADAYPIYTHSQESVYLTGTWTNSEQTKSLPVIFTEVKMRGVFE